jgi:prepilin-type N-terminal cleavage/methylation domain-containing protein
MRCAFTIVEIVIALAILAVVIGAVFTAMGSSWMADRVTEERDRAIGAAVRQIETIQQLRVADSYDRLSVTGGYTFEVPGLAPVQGATRVGTISLPAGATRNDTVLRLSTTITWAGSTGDQTITIPYSHIDR